MTIVLELGWGDYFFLAMAMVALLASLASGFGYPQVAMRLAKSPLGLALIGAACLVFPVANELAQQAPVFVGVCAFAFWAVLLMGGSVLDARAKRELDQMRRQSESEVSA
ncbi:MAG: hypothetical protein AAF578_04620 [Pseudomonadota bacterium]